MNRPVSAVFANYNSWLAKVGLKKESYTHSTSYMRKQYRVFGAFKFSIIFCPIPDHGGIARIAEGQHSAIAEPYCQE